MSNFAESLGSSSADATRVTLIVGLKQGDDEAWRRMVHIYSPLVYGCCRRWGLSPEDAADVSQETFRAAASAIGNYQAERGPGTFRGWLRQIARNKAADLWRRRGKDPARAAGHLTEAPDLSAQKTDDEDLPSELTGVVRRTLDLLQNEFEPNTWKAFWETAVEGRSGSEVAAELNLTANAVRVAKCKILRRLREELGEPRGKNRVQ